MATISKNQIEDNISTRIIQKTEEASITKNDIATTLLEMLTYTYEQDEEIRGLAIYVMNKRRVLPNTTEGVRLFCICSQAGRYTDEEETVGLIVNDGEHCILYYDGNTWEKMTINTLAQDINSSDKNILASQYLVKTLYDRLNNSIGNVRDSIPDVSGFLTQAAGDGRYVSDNDYSTDRDAMELRISNLEKYNGSVYSYELLSSQADGKNTLFSTSRKFIAGSTRVYLNGQRYFRDISYVEEIDNQSIRVQDTLPERNDIFVIEAIFIESEE